ncbi:unnamed protein product [Schistosoma margrebowiei]|uniref:Uncharacterized protein n=1 Tax=Schistosoma margrebowiei TaxID=48269 RepID=A0A183LCM3_9TREM|nr:unnamed protein product [Schistosoma margrebowiei]
MQDEGNQDNVILFNHLFNTILYMNLLDVVCGLPQYCLKSQAFLYCNSKEGEKRRREVEEEEEEEEEREEEEEEEEEEETGIL